MIWNCARPPSRVIVVWRNQSAFMNGINKTQEGKLPQVEVKTTEGQLPAYNIQGPNVEVGSKTETIKVPTVHVTTPGQRDHPSQ
jgi:hypothetical protein